MNELKRVSKSVACDRFAEFMSNHIIAGNFWDDESYEDDVVCLAVLGYEEAIESVKRNGYSLKRVNGKI
jgi:hypothetical protein